MKPLEAAKSRLAGELAADRRATLSMAMLDHVLRTVHAADTIAEAVVVGGDAAVRWLCDGLGVAWSPEGDEGPDLNRALRRAFASSAADGFDAALFLPSDLPLVSAADLDGLVAACDGPSRYGEGRLVVAPDRAGEGTNALLVPAGTGFEPLLGPGSFRRHVDQARGLGLSWREYRSDGLGLDVDTPADLALLLDRRPDWWRWAGRAGSAPTRA
jgi:2-phospho-L-lactate guanylyltransferase